MTFKSDSPLPEGVLRAVGGGLILLAIVITGAALGQAAADLRAAIVGGILASILGFTGLVLLLHDKAPVSWRRLFHFFFGSLSLLIGLAVAVWVVYSLFTGQAPALASAARAVLSPLVFMGMGVFWLRRAFNMGSPTQVGQRAGVKVLDDRIWLTSAAKFAGIRREIAERRGSQVSVIVLIAHFPDVLAGLAHIADEAHAAIPIRVCLAKSLTTDLLAADRLDESATLLIIVGERHPAPTHDEAVVRFAEGLNCRCEIIFHLSLEDPLMQV
jgi:hypothetical protein